MRVVLVYCGACGLFTGMYDMVLEKSGLSIETEFRSFFVAG
jgi:hypothetical protein